MAFRGHAFNFWGELEGGDLPLEGNFFCDFFPYPITMYTIFFATLSFAALYYLDSVIIVNVEFSSF
jgi:hypothetical protein